MTKPTTRKELDEILVDLVVDVLFEEMAGGDPKAPEVRQKAHKDISSVIHSQRQAVASDILGLVGEDEQTTTDKYARNFADRANRERNLLRVELRIAIRNYMGDT